MANKENATTSNDDLARMVQEGFSEAKEDRDTRFKEVDEHLDVMDKRLERIENTLLENHESRIKRIEEALNI